MRPARSLPARIRSQLITLHRDESGQALTEYIVILGAISLVVVNVLGALCEALHRLSGQAVDGLDALTLNLD